MIKILEYEPLKLQKITGNYPKLTQNYPKLPEITQVKINIRKCNLLFFNEINRNKFIL